MKIKRGRYSASIAGIKPEAVLGIIVCMTVFQELHHSFQLSSGIEGPHRDRRLHFVGLSFDISSGSILPQAQRTITCLLIERLGDEFDVVREKDHWHIEFQPKRQPAARNTPCET